MNTEHVFAPAARAALHCDALLAHRITDDDRLAALARFAADWATGAARRLAEGIGGSPQVAFEEPTFTAPATFAAQANRGGALHRLLAAGGGSPGMHLSVFADGVDAAIARMFGGAPEPEVSPSARAPRSSTGLFQARIMHALEAELGAMLDRAGLSLRASERPGMPGHLPGARGEVAAIGAVIEGMGEAPCRLLVGLRQDVMTTLLAAARGSGSAATVRDPAAGPWGAVPLPLRAVLADVPLPLSRLATLKVGETLALPLARRVPLTCGEAVIAWGSVGEMDDCVALRVTELAQGHRR